MPRKEIFKIIGKAKVQGTLGGRTAGSHSERKVLQMQKESTDNGQQDTAIDEELIDTLIAISVVAKRLAVNLRKQNTENGGKDNEQNE